MKKKMIPILVAFAITVAACSSFAGCTSAEDIISDVVTEEEWKAAFALENFENCKITLVDSTVQTRVQDGVITGLTYHEYKAVLADKKESFIYKYKSTGSLSSYDWDEEKRGETFVDNSGEETVYYEKVDGGRWEKSLYTIAGGNVLGFVYDLGEYFSSTEYIEEEKGYVVVKNPLAIPEFLPYGNCYKLKDGKLVAIYAHYVHNYSTKGEVVEETLSVTFTYGGQRLNAPKVY